MKIIGLRQIDSVFPVILSSENLASQPKKKRPPEKKNKNTVYHILFFFPRKSGENLANLWRETQNQFGAA